MEPILPFEPIRATTVPEGNQWVYQVKWDGVRILTYNDASSVTLFNRKKNERTHQFPELTNPSYSTAQSFILDGEVIALAADGKPSFHEVMRRDGIRRMGRIPQAKKEIPITYMIFDIVYLNGEWMNKLPLHERQRILTEIIVPNEHIQLVTSHTDGHGLLAAIRDRDMEGIVAKDLNSTYTIEGKDDRWIKVKNYGDVIAVIGGFTLSGGIVNAVLTGLYHEEKLYFIGKVGTGKLTSSDWRDLTVKLMKMEIAQCPFAEQHPEFKGAHWVSPLMTAKIQYSEWRIHEGRTMRQPSIQAFVEVPPEECIFE
ncbi:DNA ligase [Cohnella sp.]|uniref:ATP-dependent DNA ligase n=1 Tax=Cohnella sp. TaxID=1883426 RepID=UPI00356AF934